MDKRKSEEAREYLERIPSFAKKKHSLPEIREFLSRMGNPDREFRIFHVAGTNGKGSVCAFLTAALLEAGHSCGTFVSPHLSDIRERFLVNGKMVSEEAFLRAFETVAALLGPWEEEGHSHPTYFEFLFYMGMVLFREAGAEFLILETGMGGLNDVTNVVESPLVSVITSVSVDHTAYLGDTVEKIAAHKAGIIKEGRPVAFDGTSEEAKAVILKQAARMGSPAYEAVRPEFSGDGRKLFIVCPYLGRTEEFCLPFAAPYQAGNGASAVLALSVSGLGIPAETVRAGFLKARWPARMEEVRPGVYLDGAHNEDGMRAFLEAASFVSEARKPRRTLFLFAVSSDKDYRAMLREIAGELSPSVWFLTRMDSARALSVSELRETLLEISGRQADVRSFDRAGDALSAMFLEKGTEDLAFIAGSLYLVGEIKKEMDHD